MSQKAVSDALAGAGGGGIEVIKTFSQPSDVSEISGALPEAQIIKIDDGYYLIGCVQYYVGSGEQNLQLNLGEGYRNNNFGFAILAGVSNQFVSTDLTDGVLSIPCKSNSTMVNFPMIRLRRS